mmetsp:Transcript_20188/g.39190  ORF Transcript_20188/g.39190 Transcript_20188/m.39190 type:complete len:222 (+) Transcript_20188:22-687(+)
MFFFISSLGNKLPCKKKKNFSKNSPQMSDKLTKFASFIAGEWTNKKQATEFPNRWSHIQVCFQPMEFNFLNGYSFYVESAYEISLDEPYKTGIMCVEEKDGIIKTKNFSIIRPEDFWYGSYEPSLLKTLTKEKLISLPAGCNTEFEYDSEKEIFTGHTTAGKGCIIPRDGKSTYLDSTFILGENEYSSIDVGKDVENDKQIWGTTEGPFIFFKKKTFSISS